MIRSRQTATRGQTLVEFSLVAFLSVMLLLSIVEISRMALVYTTVANAFLRRHPPQSLKSFVLALLVQPTRPFSISPSPPPTHTLTPCSTQAHTRTRIVRSFFDRSSPCS